MSRPDLHRAAQHLAAFLECIGMRAEDDPELAETSRRVAELLAGFAPGAEPPELSTCPALERGGVVLLRDLPFHSLCAHHLLPFFGTADIAYRPRKLLAGVGSMPRLLAHFARRPQLQERLGDQLARALCDRIQPKHLVVRLRARHLCMEMRGAASPGLLETWHQASHAWGATEFGAVDSDLVQRIQQGG